MWRVLVVGESWQGWITPIEKIASPFSDLIELINRYVSDEEVRMNVSRAGLVALSCNRSSASGSLHLTMAARAPVVATEAGERTEATHDYGGGRPDSLARGIDETAELATVRHEDRFSWAAVADSPARVLCERPGAHDAGTGVPR